MEKAGGFITIEGIDGAGKSLQTMLLVKGLCSRGLKAVATFEPGGGEDGDMFREILASDKAHRRWSRKTEILLFTAARRHHLETFIFPALKQGQFVVSDRFVDSTRVYQGLADQELRKLTDELHGLMIGKEADLTFIVDVPVETALARVHARSGGDARLESYGTKLEGLRQSFRALGQSNAARCRLVDGDACPEDIAEEILTETLRQFS